MSWLLLLKTFGSTLLKHWQATLLVLAVALTGLYIHILRSENQTLTTQNQTLTAANVQYAKNEKIYQQDITDQNKSILALKALGQQQQDAMNAAQTKAIADSQTYAAVIAKLRAEKFPTDCRAVMNLMLQKALEANGHG